VEAGATSFMCERRYIHYAAVWLCSITLVSAKVVTLRQARLVPGWVTVFGQVNHLGAEPVIHTQPERSLGCRRFEYPAKAE